MTMFRRISITLLLAITLLPLAAQEKADTAFVFRFVADKDMLFSPYNGNGEELTRLTECIDRNRAAIDSGQMYLLVTSYGTTGNADQTASQVAKIRRNRVKSELITRTGIKEQNFVTDRSYLEPYTTDGNSLRDVVVVILPASVAKVAEIAGTEAAAKVEAYNRATGIVIDTETSEPECVEPPKQEVAEVAETVAVREEEQTVIPVAEEPAMGTTATNETKRTSHHFALRTNLLRWATLTPDLGVEWRIGNTVGIVVNGSYTSWSWNDKDRRYGLWEVSPEVRYYIGKEKRGYVGAMYKAGSFNYKFSETGKQGDIMGGGITGGYQMKLNKTLAIDFSLGVGYLNADYDTYTVIDGVRVRQGKESKNWWGPVSAGVTLVWTIF